MKPPPFTWHSPARLDEALALLERHGEEAKILAGGQTLVPAMNFRLARPDHLIDINGITDLEGVAEVGGSLTIGALARHCAFATPVTADPLGALLAEVSSHIAHYPIRVRGTFAGSLAHADPAAEWCLVAQTLGAGIVAVSARGTRTIAAEAFFRATLTTDLEPHELIREVRLPLLGANAVFGFEEISRRRGDFALAMTLTVLWIEDGKIGDARLGVGGAGRIPLRVRPAEAALIGHAATEHIAEAAADAAADHVDVVGDLHGTADYRRDLVRAMTRRSIEAALARA